MYTIKQVSKITTSFDNKESVVYTEFNYKYKSGWYNINNRLYIAANWKKYI